MFHKREKKKETIAPLFDEHAVAALIGRSTILDSDIGLVNRVHILNQYIDKKEVNKAKTLYSMLKKEFEEGKFELEDKRILHSILKNQFEKISAL